MTAVIGQLVSLRGAAYVAYRSSLGPDGYRLPEQFEAVVNDVIGFADLLLAAADPVDNLEPDSSPLGTAAGVARSARSVQPLRITGSGTVRPAPPRLHRAKLRSGSPPRSDSQHCSPPPQLVRTSGWTIRLGLPG